MAEKHTNHLEKPSQIVKSMHLANFLLEKDFRIKEIQRNVKTNGSVFFFENSPALQEAINDYLKDFKSHKKQ